jgi:RsiW-degrading membrane proteinase PrsW (M82 family)
MTAPASTLDSADLQAAREGGFWQPRRQAFWWYLAILAVALYSYAPSLIRTVGEQPLLMLISLAVWALWALPFLCIIYSCDLFEREPLSLLAAALAWGAFVTIVMAGTAITQVGQLVAKLAPDLLRWLVAIDSPVLEETVKTAGVVLIALIAPHAFNRLMDGLVYGMMVGLGFAFIENFGYAAGAVAGAGGDMQTAIGQAIRMFVLRGVLFAPWAHLAYTGIAGLGVAYVLTRTDRSLGRRLTVAIGLFALAVLFHAATNAATLLGALGLLAILANSILVLVVLVLLYRYAQRAEYHWFESVLGDRIGTNLITADEVRSLSTLALRRQAREAARRAGGRARAGLVRDLQHSQLAYAAALAKRTGTSSSPAADRIEAKILQVRRQLDRSA